MARIDRVNPMDVRIKNKIKERLERCIHLREIGAPEFILKNEQAMLFVHRLGHLFAPDIRRRVFAAWFDRQPPITSE